MLPIYLLCKTVILQLDRYRYNNILVTPRNEL